MELSHHLVSDMRRAVNFYLSRVTGSTVDKILRDSQRDTYLTPYEAKTYGIIDHVVTNKTTLSPPTNPPLTIIPSTIFTIEE